MMRFAAVVAVGSAGATNVSWGKEPMKISSTGPDSTLPSFIWMAGDEEGGSLMSIYNHSGGTGTPLPYNPGVGCPDDVFDNVMPDMRVPKLPWALQESWGCEREPTEADVLVVENEILRAAITPQWGGRVWSLFHKKLGRQLFFNNPAHQPANIGYRKAWTAGGAEWNWSPGHVGHSVFSESPVYTAVLNSTMGPVVRVWEYDRLNGTVWQVDMLFDDDGMMWAHPKVTNPNEAELPGYWWTCVAMPVDYPSAKTRIISPATGSVNYQCAS